MSKTVAQNRKLRAVILLTILCIPAVVFILSTLGKPATLEQSSQRQTWDLRAVHRTPLRCVRVVPDGKPQENVGSVVKFNQLAFFLASWYNIPLQLPVSNTARGPHLHEAFGQCPDNKKNPATAKPGQDQPCTLDMKRMVLKVCRSGDCQCLIDAVTPYLDRHIKLGCREINVMNNGFQTTAYAGCIGPVLDRYLGGDDRKPTWKYDAIYFRKGEFDPERRDGRGNMFPKQDSYYVMRTLCMMSDRDIVVITEGSPKVPECGNRLVLAGDVSVQDAFRIFKHAQTVSAGVNSFASALMEVARPVRAVIRDNDMWKYEWVQCDKWSIVTYDGGAFHFTNRAMMIEYLFSNRLLRDNFRRSEGMARDDIITESVPKRRWSKEMMRPGSGQ